MNKHPYWLRKKAHDPSVLLHTKSLLSRLKLHSVCESAQCPNQGLCFNQGTITFLILGDRCTRNCGFCAISKGTPSDPDPNEPINISEAVRKLNLNYVVVTSVTRDDLPDGGASHFAKVVEAIKSIDPAINVELLVPDFGGSLEAIREVAASSPQVISHNLETVPRLYAKVRPKANYTRSLDVLNNIKLVNSKIISKSSLMLGFEEDFHEILEVMDDLRRVNCDLITLGQYLPPSSFHYPLSRYVTLEEFHELEDIGVSMGFRGIISGPFVRSSFNAANLYQKLNSGCGIFSDSLLSKNANVSRPMDH